MKKSQVALDIAKYLLEITKDIYVNPEIRWNKNSIVISSSGYNQLIVRSCSNKNVLVAFRYGNKQEEIQEHLESHGVQYTEHRRELRFELAPEKFKEKNDMFIQLAHLNKEWWIG